MALMPCNKDNSLSVEISEQHCIFVILISDSPVHTTQASLGLPWVIFDPVLILSCDMAYLSPILISPDLSAELGATWDEHVLISQ